jgi:hypothetical protein
MSVRAPHGPGLALEIGHMTNLSFLTVVRALPYRRLLLAATTVLLISNGRGITAQTSPVATVGLTAGWATFGEAVPQGAARDGLQVGALLTQTDVKSRWADGSIRFAIVTVNAPAGATYDLTAAAAPGGTFTPTVPDASVTLTIGGVTYVAALPNAPSSDVWLSGPLVSESRTTVAPISTATGAAHPFLRVNFDSRVYSDSSARVDVSVENLLDKAGATTVTYDATIAVNGQTVFTKPGVQHYYLTRWRKVFAVGTTPLATITPDMRPFNAAQALPPYLALVANQVSTPSGATYDILSSGALDPNMPAHGGRPELAPYPDWTARYLVHRNATQRSFVLANGDLSGSWPVHVREAEGGAKSGVGSERFVSLDQRPTLWYDQRAQSSGLDYIKGTPMPIREYGSLTPGPGQTALIPDNAHQPSLAYVPYLITGDRYYAEEMAFWANYGMLRTYNGDGVRNSAGILESNEVRGYGWALRNLVDAAAYYPDASPMKAYLSQKVTNNLKWLDTYANAQDPVSNPFRVLWLNERPDGAQYIGLWEQNYLAYAIDRASKQGFTGGLAHRDAIAKFQLMLFSSDPDYPRAQGAPYVVGVGTPGTPFIFAKTPAAIWAMTAGQERPFAGYYGPEARLNLMMGVENGWPGARAAYDYLWPFIGVTPNWGSLPDLAQRAGWALDFAASTPPPPPPPTPVPAQMTSPAAGATLTSASQTFAWTAGTGVASYRLYVGRSVGASDIYAGTAGTSLSNSVAGLPTDGSTVSVRLWSSIDSVWQYVDYSYVSATIAPPLSISSPAAGAITTTTATITWLTNLAATSRVDCGPSVAYEYTVIDPALVMNHTTQVTGLTPSTTYHFKLTSQTGAGDATSTGDLTFVTAAAPPPPPPPPPPPTGVGVDVNISSNGGDTRSVRFTTAAAGELVVAFAGSDGPKSGSQSLTVSGAGLAWTLVRRVNTQSGTSEIWAARASGILSDVTVTSKQTQRGYRQSLTVMTFTGAGTGASAGASAATGAPSVSLTTTTAGSLVYAVGNDWDRAVARTIGAGQLMVRQWVDTNTGDTYWLQAWATAIATPSSVRLFDVAPTGDRWNFAAIEIAPRP